MVSFGPALDGGAFYFCRYFFAEKTRNYLFFIRFQETASGPRKKPSAFTP
jgi:hypothetical protein